MGFDRVTCKISGRNKLFNIVPNDEELKGLRIIYNCPSCDTDYYGTTEKALPRKCMMCGARIKKGK